MNDQRSLIRDMGPVDVAASRWAQRGAVTFGVAKDSADESSVLSAIGRALSFPDYYGQNLDALDDCLRDLAWLPEGPVVLVWDDTPLLYNEPDTYRAVLAILANAAAAQAGGTRPLRVVLINSGA